MSEPRTFTSKPNRLQVSTCFAVTPSDTLYLNGGTSDDDYLFYCTTTGNVRVLTADGQDIIFPVVNIGWQALMVSKIFATSTTVTTIFAGR